MTDEMKHLVEDAAKLLELKKHQTENIYIRKDEETWRFFRPLDPEYGDLMKVAMAAELDVDHEIGTVTCPMPSIITTWFQFNPNNYNSLALAILRAASAVLKARNENEH